MFDPLEELGAQVRLAARVACVTLKERNTNCTWSVVMRITRVDMVIVATIASVDQKYYFVLYCAGAQANKRSTHPTCTQTTLCHLGLGQ